MDEKTKDTLTITLLNITSGLIAAIKTEKKLPCAYSRGIHYGFMKAVELSGLPIEERDGEVYVLGEKINA